MTTNIPQGTLLDVLKKKMRQTKEEMEKYKDECEEYHKRLQLEVVRREEVSSFFKLPISIIVSYIQLGLKKELKFCLFIWGAARDKLIDFEM